MKTLQKRIGYEFANPQLLEVALTHPSLRHDKSYPLGDNQRLEFLGDAVIQLAISELLYKKLQTP